MKVIKQLSEHMQNELDDAHEYIKEALFLKDTDRQLAEMYHDLANQELSHAEAQHNQAVRIIREYGAEAPPAMQAVWDYLHERIIEQKADIKRLISMFRE